MSIIQSDLLLGQEGSGKYQVSRSLRFDGGSYLSRTPGSAGNRRAFTLSFWLKRNRTVSGEEIIFQAGSTSISSGSTRLCFANDQLDVRIDGNNSGRRLTTAVFRDFSAWYHILLAVDTTLANAADRIKVYVNGTQQTVFSTSTDTSQNFDTAVNSTERHVLGVGANSGGGFDSGFFSGYLAECHLIDGSALTPSSFAETDATTGQWIPRLYSGSFGSQGWKLTFADNSAATAAALGKDTSGNSNNWTPNNLSVTAGAGNDSLVDTPTSYGTDTSAGGEVRGNYATLNPLKTNSSVTLTNGNLDAVSTSGSWVTSFATIGITSGKWYWEGTCTRSSGNEALLGIAQAPATLSGYVGVDSYGWCYYTSASASYKINNASTASYGATYTNGDVIGVALDLNAGTLTFYKNGTSQGTAYSSLSGEFFPAISCTNSSAWVMNFGQRAFAYPVSGFKALVDTNLTAPVIAKPNTVFDVKTYSANNGTQAITGLNFSPDLVWTKSRSNAYIHNLYDTVRGATKYLKSNSTEAEGTNANTLISFDSAGFTLGQLDDSNYLSGSSVAWAWDAGTSTVTNNVGSITSSVRANTSAGFSVITYTPGSGGAHTIGHGLGVTPAFYIIKSRGAATDWRVYHKNLPTPATDYLTLNSTAAYATASNYWNGGPTSTLIGLGNYSAINDPSVNFVCYAFSPVAGYSSFGSYTGNGSADGPFVFCNFRPRWIMIKRTDAAYGWYMYDTARDTYNIAGKELLANASDAEVSDSDLDILSNGFKPRRSSLAFNASGGTFVYAAFAESPFAYARAR